MSRSKTIPKTDLTFCEVHDLDIPLLAPSSQYGSCLICKVVE